MGTLVEDNANRYVVGTFNGVDESPEIRLSGEFRLQLNFASTGSVTLKSKMPGESGFTDVKVYTSTGPDSGFEAASSAVYKLACTAAAGAITYWLGQSN